MSTVNRRDFLRQTTYATAGGAIAAGPLAGLLARAAGAAPDGNRRAGKVGYGPLGPVADKTTGEPLLWLPEGFEYRSFGRTGEPMSDGNPTPPLHDGMACFAVGKGRYRLVRNHELYPRASTSSSYSPAFGDPATAYDPEGGGGTTTLVVSAHGKVDRSFVSCNGTIANCAGGPTPWGTWISGEESTNGDDQKFNFRNEELTLTKPHGYLFEVPAGDDGAAPRTPIKSAGRFAHEAIAVDPGTGVVYETQDRFAGPSGFYRYTAPTDPWVAGALADGGTLEMLRVPEHPDLSGHVTAGSVFAVEWVTIDDPDPDMAGLSDDDGGALVVDQGLAKGGTGFSRLEGCWYADGKVFFASTQGGTPDFPKLGYGAGAGQVWCLDIAAQTLSLVVESPSPDVLDMPDNLTISPKGNLLLCEDSSGDNFLRGLTRDGQVFDFALNRIPGAEKEEWAGACFSPDGKTLFVNIQTPGVTFAIWGPWARGAL